MPAAAIVGAAVLGAAGTAYSVNQQKKAARAQSRRIDQQEEQAKIEARESALLDASRDEGGADIKLGREKSAAAAQPVTGTAPAAATTRAGAVAGRVGGVGGQQSTGGSKRVGGFLLNPSKVARRLGF